MSAKWTVRWCGLFDGLAFHFRVGMGIDESCLDLRMAKPLGEEFKAHPVLIQVHCPRMPQQMWMNAAQSLSRMFGKPSAVMAEEFNMDVYTCALNGGEDYELLFTVPLTDHDKVIQLRDIKLIGHMTRPELGRNLVTKSGQEIELKAQGWTSNL